MKKGATNTIRTNLCGRKLTQIVSHGSVILTELQRMAQHIPQAFFPPETTQSSSSSSSISSSSHLIRRSAAGTSLDRRRFEPLLFDFNYFRNEDEYQDKIERNADLCDLDQTFRQQSLVILQRFYKLFSDIYMYYTGIQQFLTDVEDGIYIEYTFEAILYDPDGKRLMCESLYLYGVMLLLIDRLIPGPVRERLIVAHFRARGQSNIEHSKEIVRLFKSTGYYPGSLTTQQRRPKNYPVDYFKRYSIKSQVVQTLINQMKDDDIYKQLSAFPLPDHRSVALANQASMIFVLLFFDSELLTKQKAKMREIADKHFSDNWVIPFYLGYISDISEYWSDFNAAKLAFVNNVTTQNVRNFVVKHAEHMKSVQSQLDKFLAEGTLTQDSVLDNIGLLMQWMRQANVTIRWTMLHRSMTGNKRLRDILIETFPSMEPILQLLLRTAQFQERVKKLLTRLVKKKEKMWNQDQGDATYLVNEIAQFYAGNRNHGKGFIKDSKFQNGFKTIVQQIQNLSYDHATVAGRQISDIIGSLDDALQYRQVDGDFQVKHFIDQTKLKLQHMIRCVNIKKQDLVNFTIVSDFAYAFSSIGQYLELMQQHILAGPKSVLRLRALFLKMASLISQPLQRIIQSNNQPALQGVSRFYSSQIVRFVTQVLQVIPISIFRLLDNISLILATKVKQIPLKLNKADLKQYAQFDQRFELARLTHQITIFTQGMLYMDKCLMGVIQVDPKRLLVQGIKRQLTQKIATLLHQAFIFKKGGSGSSSGSAVLPSVEQFAQKVKYIGDRMVGMKRAFMYIQDFLDIRGDFMWNQQMAEMMNGFIERETTAMVMAGRRKQGSREDKSGSSYRRYKKKIIQQLQEDQDDEIAILLYKLQPVDSENATFIGRLARGILGLIDSKKTFYWDQGQSWYDFNGNLIFGELALHKLEQGVGIHIIKALDQFYQYSLLAKLTQFQRTIKQSIDPQISRLQDLHQEFSDCLKMQDNATKMYKSSCQIISQLGFRIQPLIIAIGQMQLLRRILIRIIKFVTKFQAGPYAKVLQNLDVALMAEWVKQQSGVSQQDRKNKQEQQGDNTADQDVSQIERKKRKQQLVNHVVKMFESAGLTNPLQKVYITTHGEVDTKHIPFIPLTLALYVIRILPELRIERRLGMVVKKSRSQFIDGASLAVGVWTVLKQYHISFLKQFLAILSHYIKTQSIGAGPQGNISASSGGVLKGGGGDKGPHVSGFTGELQSQEVATLLGFLNDFTHYSGLPLEVITQYLPTFIATVF